RVYQSGETDRRGPLAKNGPNYLRWALIEAAHTAGRTTHYKPVIERMRDRHGRRRGSALASVEIARRLTERSGGCSPATNPLLRQAPCECLTAPTVLFRIALPEQAPIEPSRPQRTR